MTVAVATSGPTGYVGRDEAREEKRPTQQPEILEVKSPVEEKSPDPPAITAEGEKNTLQYNKFNTYKNWHRDRCLERINHFL